jgi:hypothetical protein
LRTTKAEEIEARVSNTGSGHALELSRDGCW